MNDESPCQSEDGWDFSEIEKQAGLPVELVLTLTLTLPRVHNFRQAEKETPFGLGKDEQKAATGADEPVLLRPGDKAPATM